MGGLYETATALETVIVPKPKRTKNVPLWLTCFAVLGLATIYLSRHSRMELVPSPPNDFSEVRLAGKAGRQAAEARLAPAYWACAVETLQWEYPHGFELPEEPPAEFNIDAGALPDSIKGAAQSREFYWRQLRKVWGLPQSWKSVYVWDFEWLTKPFEFWLSLLDQQHRSK